MKPIKLVTRNGWLTPHYWLLREGLVQDVRQAHMAGTKARGVSYARPRSGHISELVKVGWMSLVEGPRGGKAYRTTGEGAFMVLITDGQVEAKRSDTESRIT